MRRCKPSPGRARTLTVSANCLCPAKGRACEAATRLRIAPCLRHFWLQRDRSPSYEQSLEEYVGVLYAAEGALIGWLSPRQLVERRRIG
jgi:hypothetical protein